MRYFHTIIIVSILAASAGAVDVGIGFDGGLQRAWLKGWVVETPAFGINIPAYVTKEHCAQMSLRYSPKGYEYDSIGQYESHWLHYLDIPIVYKFIPEFLPIKLGVFAGYNFCYLLNVNSKDVDGFESLPDSDKDLYVSKFDHGPMLGADLKFPLKFGEITASLAYYMGLTTVREKWFVGSTGAEEEISPQKNHAFSMLLGYEIPKIFSIGGK